MDNNKRTTTSHLPKYFNTSSNEKFFNSTFDQLIQPGVIEKINGYIGNTHTKSYYPTDYYLKDVSNERQHKQLESSAVVFDDMENVLFYKDYNDYINGLKNKNVDVSNESQINSEEYYPWEPNINWDKLINYHQYYWMPDGPPTININGIGPSHSCINKITNKNGFVFDSYNDINPTITLYRNLTYTFEINTNDIPFSIRKTSQLYDYWKPHTYYNKDDIILHNHKIYKNKYDHISNVNFDENDWSIENILDGVVSNHDVSNGTITIKLDSTTPDILYYVSDMSVTFGGMILVKDFHDAILNVDNDIIGKKRYFIDDNTELSSGMKLTFGEKTYPNKYKNSEWIVTGVGENIQLVNYDNFCKQCSTDIPDYITIGINSKDGNLWSRNNRWYHKDIIKKSYEYNGMNVFFNHDYRAKRPIIEFNAGLRLFNFGTILRQEVDLIDDFTSDIFNTIESSYGYNIDGVDLKNGMKILFTNDTKPENNNKIYKVQMIPHGDYNFISLVEVPNSHTEINHTVYARYGEKYGEKILWRDDNGWKLAQVKAKPNQAPLFSVYDNDGVELSNNIKYPFSSFNGTKLFSYKINNNNKIDDILGFGIEYQSIENIGDIVFNFDYNIQEFSYRNENENTIKESINTGTLRYYNTLYNYTVTNGYTTSNEFSKQAVCREFIAEQNQTQYDIDIFSDNISDKDYSIIAYKNSSLVDKTLYDANISNNSHYVTFKEKLNKNDHVSLKIYTNDKVKDTELFEMPINLSNNPNNDNIKKITYSEIMNHVRSIAENLPSFTGTIPGITNIRDLGNISKYGTKIIKHSSPLNIVMYNLLSEQTNLINAIDFCKTEYGKFKRNFIRFASDNNLNGNIKEQVDYILKELNDGRSRHDPFYFSDMVPYSAGFKREYIISNESEIFFPINEDYNLNEPNSTAINIYLNDKQLIINEDYEFNNNGFVVLHANKENNDVLSIYEYFSTNGSHIPPTPTKLGLYPKYIPKIIIDDTYLVPQKVIIGHDGSKTIAYNDYRDDVLLELEKRIFNNIKINQNIFNIYNFLPGLYRKTGLTKNSLEQTLLSDFRKWTTLVDNTYSINNIYKDSEPFTYNYKNSVDSYGNVISGTWKNIYKHIYDTDSPHITPWEMLGYSIQPNWWTSIYGIPPYTKDNLVLWNDLENGMIREPGNERKNILFERPNLTSHIPVDQHGKLLNPIDSMYISKLNMSHVSDNFIYGDGSPIELTWKNNSEYRYSLIKGIFLNFPARTFASGFDLYRQQYKNNILKYNTTDFSAKDIIFPSSGHESVQTYTSGFINFIREAYSTEKNVVYDKYKTELLSLQNRLGAKLAGFTSKDKFKLFFDSKKPSKNNNNMVINQSNYKIFLNSSTPVEIKNYSGVIIEKHSTGFIINGYDIEDPTFKYNKCLDKPDDKKVNIGGVSEPFSVWENNKTYSIGNIIKYQNKFYRTIKYHTTSGKFEQDNYASMPFLPIIGGKTVTFRDEFQSDVSTVKYGTILPTIQDVIDFLFGYDNILKENGFEFNGVNTDGTIQNWKTSIREFVYWTTTGTSPAIAISPGAKSLEIKSSTSVLNALNGTQNDYLIVQADGSKINPQTIAVDRTNPNHSKISTQENSTGLYGSRLELIQKEHVLILDDFTEFNDIIYNQISGFRQPRIKINGYRTVKWDGSLNIPGFIYDQGKIVKWEPWKEYNIGDTIKYKEFYYTATEKIHGSDTFTSEKWTLLQEKPESGLYPNIEYKINQFEDFYNLDTDNFDTEQQKFAQHLIGYQPRKYLQNVIDDDVSQYKLYQGYISEKGTKNTILKMFNPLSGNITIDEEWAIKTGQYGAINGLHDITFNLKECNAEPQPLYISNNKKHEKNKHTAIQYFDKKEVQYQSSNSTDLPTIHDDKFILPNIGKVNPNHVTHIIKNIEELLTLENIQYSDHIWVTNDDSSWDITTQTLTEVYVYNIIDLHDNIIKANVHNNTLIKDDIIVLVNYDELEKRFIVTESTNDTIILKTYDSIKNISPGECFANIIKYDSCRVNNINDANNYFTNNKNISNRLWIDNTNNNWQVIEKINNFTWNNKTENIPINYQNTISNINMVVDYTNSRMVLGRPDDGRGTIYVYYRQSNSSEYKITQIIQATTNEYGYGNNVLLSNDNNYLIIAHTTATIDNKNLAGKVDIYKRGQYNMYEFHKEIHAKDVIRGDNFGIEIHLQQTDNINRLFVLSKRQNGGNIHIFKEGTIDGIYYDWESNKDIRYKGEFSPALSYNKHDIVSNNGIIYQTSIDTTPSPDTSAGNWEIIHIQNDFTDIIRTEDILPQISNEEGRNTYQVNQISTNMYGEIIASYKSSGVLGGVIVIFENVNGHYIITEKIYNENNNFGFSINAHNDFLTVSSPAKYDKNDEIYLYRKENNKYVLHQTLTVPYWSTFKQYGIKIEQSDNLLTITAEQGNNKTPINFDSGDTTFDNRFCSFVDTDNNVGSINIYEKVNNYFIYSQSINFNNKNNISLSASKLVNDNIIYIGSLTESNSCVINEYRKNNSFFDVIGEYKPTVDTSLIKSVSLYDGKTNKIKRELDFIDVFQGKIIETAKEQISFITNYDPAVYVMGDENLVNIDPVSCWLEKNVGKIWWDLSSSKFIFPHQSNTIFSATMWNNEVYKDDLSVYEWTESTLKPSEWDSKSDKTIGKTNNITGKTKYGDNAYSTRKKYDPVSKTFTTYYYYWVRNKLTSNNNISAKAIVDLIKSPSDIGYKYISFISPREFALYNCSDIIDDDTILKIQYWSDHVFKNSKIHSEYKLITENTNNRSITQSIREKWHDSLVGQDKNGRMVPDSTLKEDMKYGTLFYPQQSWFKNRVEALKQVLHKTNNVLKNTQIIDKKDISRLFEKENEPDVTKNLYDTSIDSLNNLSSVNTYNFVKPIIELVIENGKINSIIILEAGAGYENPPVINIDGSGKDALFDVSLNSIGGIDNIEIINSGQNYTDKDKVKIREYSVLVHSDETKHNKWAIYEFNSKSKRWKINRLQNYDVQEYWNYIDWYSPGYDENTHINYLIDEIHDLYSTNFDVGSIIKVQNVGAGGWEIYKKESSENFVTIGKKNGTIYFEKKLYDPNEFKISYDTISYDNSPYDVHSYKEVRIILEALRDDILIDDLAIEYNKLFFSSIYYVLSESNYVDWIFKTSFIKIKYGDNKLQQSNMHKIDNSVNYEQYIKEIKPFKTKIREYVTAYNNEDIAPILSTDFELNIPEFNGNIPIMNNNTLITNENSNIDNTWYNNKGFVVEHIEIEKSSITFDNPPIVQIIGDSIHPAKGKTILNSDNTIQKIEIYDNGSGYLQAPTVELIHNGVTVNIQTKAILGKSCWRTIQNKIKFDRVGTNITYNDDFVEEEFNITNDTNVFELKWPMELKRNMVYVEYNGYNLIQSEYTYSNVINNDKTYTRLKGEIRLSFVPDEHSIIKVTYKRNTNIMYASDRIKNFYKQTLGQYPKNISNLMLGSEYSGIHIYGGDFLDAYTWDTHPWMVSKWNIGIDDDDYYDSEIDGGKLDYSNTNSIVYKGSSFNDVHNPGPEELVTGTVSESYFIKIIENDSNTSWAYFNDNTNKTHYTRIKNKTTLASDLSWDDDTIELTDDITEDAPGVLFINKERIIYHEKTGNTIKNLTRGTYGTGTPEITLAGEMVIDQGKPHIIPYNDTITESHIEFKKDKFAYILPYIVDSNNNIEIYMNGRKLRKNDIELYNPYKNLDSPEADDNRGAEFIVMTNPGYDSFSLDMVEYSLSPTILGNDGYSLLILNPQYLDIEPQDGDTIKIVKKEGMYWHSDGQPISTSTSAIATFLKG